MSTQLEDPDAAVLVADYHGEVIGYAYAAVEGYDYMLLRGPAGVLHDLIVGSGHRGRGVGRLLLDAVLEFLRSRGAPRMVLSTAERNEAAQRLFASVGFRRRERYQRLEEWARANFDVASVEFRWSSQDNNTVDGVPYIGKLSSGSEHVYVATGFKGWGMTNSHVAAMLLTDLIHGRENPWAEVFDPSRLKPVTSARAFIRENTNVAKEFVGDRATVPELDDLGKVPLGGGEVVEWKGEKVAVYKDERGTVHSCSAVCTHMGCLVRWNSAERSWDCPCHGSRFDCDGRAVQGPANEDLEPREL